MESLVCLVSPVNLDLQDIQHIQDHQEWVPLGTVPLCWKNNMFGLKRIGLNWSTDLGWDQTPVTSLMIKCMTFASPAGSDVPNGLRVWWENWTTSNAERLQGKMMSAKFLMFFFEPVHVWRWLDRRSLTVSSVGWYYWTSLKKNTWLNEMTGLQLLEDSGLFYLNLKS